MKHGKLGAQGGGSARAGFSLTELVVALAIALILMAIGLPSFLRAYHSYQLTNAASQVADILRLTRYEAIRRNKQLNCIVQVSGSDPTLTNVWADSDGDGTQNPGEPTVLLGPAGNLVDAGSVPGTSTLISQAVGATTTAAPSPSGAAIAFDARGAVTSENVSVFYLASKVAPEAGYRAVFLMPAGSIQVWSADQSGSWQRIR